MQIRLPYLTKCSRIFFIKELRKNYCRNKKNYCRDSFKGLNAHNHNEHERLP